jgi:hypothetical protein
MLIEAKGLFQEWKKANTIFLIASFISKLNYLKTLTVKPGATVESLFSRKKLNTF